MFMRYKRIRIVLAALFASSLVASASAVGAAEQVQVTQGSWGTCGFGEFKIVGARLHKETQSGTTYPHYSPEQRCARAQFGGKDVKIVIKGKLDHTKYRLCPVNQFIIGNILEPFYPSLSCAVMYDSNDRRLFITPRDDWRDSIESGTTGDHWYDLRCPSNHVIIGYIHEDRDNALERSEISCGTAQYQK